MLGSEIIVTITPSKAAVSETIKLACFLGSDLGDWLQHTQHSSVTRCFVIFFTVTPRLGPRLRTQRSLSMLSLTITFLERA